MLGLACGALAWPVVAAAEPSAALVTIGPGEALWTRYGHVAVRIVDEEAGVDLVYSFGAAPFDQPDFILDHLRGRSFFFLAFDPWDVHLALYRDEDRTMRVRPLALTVAQAGALADRLAVNALPENADYLYSHLDDNCSTRVRDVLDAVTAGALRRAARGQPPARRFRDEMLAGVAGDFWGLVGLDLIGGPNLERRPNAWQAAYLPANLERLALRATNVVDGQARPLAGPAQTPLRRRGPALGGSVSAGRRGLLLAWLGLALLVLAGGRRPGWPARAAAVGLGAAAIVSAVLGLVFTVLVVISSDADFGWNENVVAFVPLDLVLVGSARRWLSSGTATIGPRTRAYVAVRLGALAVLVALKLAGVCRQDNWTVLVCVTALLGALLVARTTPIDAPAPAARRRGRRGRARP